MRIRVLTMGLVLGAGLGMSSASNAAHIVPEMVEQASPSGDVRYDIMASETIAWTYVAPIARRGGGSDDAIIRHADRVDRRPVQVPVARGPVIASAVTTVVGELPASGAGFAGTSGGGGGGRGLASIFAADERSLDRGDGVEIEALDAPEVDLDPILSDLFVAIRSREERVGLSTVGQGRAPRTSTPDALVVPIPGALGMGLVGLSALGVMTIRRRIAG